jgi:hypothetical protein
MIQPGPVDVSPSGFVCRLLFCCPVFDEPDSNRRHGGSRRVEVTEGLAHATPDQDFIANCGRLGALQALIGADLDHFEAQLAGAAD